MLEVGMLEVGMLEVGALEVGALAVGGGWTGWASGSKRATTLGNEPTFLGGGAIFSFKRIFHISFALKRLVITSSVIQRTD